MSRLLSSSLVTESCFLFLRRFRFFFLPPPLPRVVGDGMFSIVAPSWMSISLVWEFLLASPSSSYYLYDA